MWKFAWAISCKVFRSILDCSDDSGLHVKIIFRDVKNIVLLMDTTKYELEKLSVSCPLELPSTM